MALRGAAARRVLASVVASCVLVAGLATSAGSAAADTGEGFVNRESLCREASEPFDDVDGGHVAAYAVACLYVLGIVYGHTPSSYDPSGMLRRNQLAAMLERAWRGVGRDCPEVAARYVDIADDWAKASIDCLWALGATVATTVTAGIHGDAPGDAPTTPPAGNNDAATVGASSPDGDAVHPAAPPTAAGEAVHPSAPPTAAAALEPLLFHPDGSVTNAQFALVVAKTWQVAGFSCEPHDGFDFTDVDYTSEAGPAIECLQSLAVVPLYRGATEFHPDTPITRGEAAILLARLWRYGPLAPPLTTTAITISVPLGPITQPPIQQDQPLQQDPPAQDPEVLRAPDAPGAPGLAAGNTEIDASWTEPDNGGSEITGYRVQHRAAGASTQGASASSESSWTTSEWLDADQLSHTLEQLTNGTEYEVKVRARNAVGESGWSAPATATPAEPDSAPAAPAAPTLAPGNATLLASWSPPANDGGSPITGYRVKHRLGGFSISSQSSWTTTDWLDADQLSHKIISLTNGKTYEVRVQARNALGESDWSNPTAGMPRTVPATPAAPTLVPSDQELTASWTAPDAGGHPITGYKVRHRATGTTDWTTSDALGSSTKSQEIESLTNGTEYEVQVQAINDTGPGGWSDSAKATPRTVPATPAAPTLTAADQKLTARWTAPNNGGSKITGYKVRHRATGTSSWTTLSVDKSPLSREIKSLTNGTEYEVQVQATNAAGDSGWSDSAEATPQTMPSKPLLTLTPADQKITASWTAPSDGGSEITGYKVRHRETSDTDPNPNTWTTTSALNKTTTSYGITGLTNGTEYEVQVQATNAVDDSGWSDSAKATPRTVPSKPSPTLTAADQKLTASWTAPDNGGSAITGYTVRYKKTSDTGWTTSNSQTGLSYEIGSLTNGTEYEVQVQATNAAGGSGYSDSAKAKPRTVPSKPSPTLTAADQELTASWSAPSDGGSDITGYTIRHRATGTTTWTTSNSQTGTSYEISSLTNGTEYEVQVQATNAAGDSGYSDSVKAKPRTVPSKPSPTLGTADQKLTASWNAPDNGGSEITGYKVRHRVTDTGSWTTSSALGSSATSYEITGLTNGEEYEVQVQATNAAGDSGWSDSVKAKPRTMPSKPAAPTLASSDQKLTATWTAPPDGSSPITSYTIRHRVTDTGSWTTSSALGTSTLSYEITGLTNGTEYEVQVQATNTAGDSGYSDSAKAKPCTVPSKPAAPTLASSDQKLTASWTEPSGGGCDITGYTIRHRATGTTTWTTSSSQTGTSYEIGSLTNGSEYEVQVQATNAAGDSGYSDSAKAKPYTVPSKPSPTLTGSDQKLTVDWSAPNNGGSDITGYTIRHRQTGTTTWTTSSSQTGTSYEIGSLTNGSEYEVQVQATNAAGDSGYSDSVKAKPCTVPSKPSPSVTPADRKLTVTWTAPDNGGCDITGYTVRHRSSKGTWTTSSSQTGLSYEIGSLFNGTRYEVQVQATNAAGDSGYSDSVSAKPRTVPDKPSPTLTAADEKLTASWSHPATNGSNLTGYKVRHRQTGTTTWTTSSALSETATSYEITGLTNGTEYEVQVQATNAAGDSGYSDSVKAKPRTVPSKPAAPTLAKSDKKLTATWTAPSDGGSDITGYKVRHRETSDTDPNPNTWTTSSSLGTSTLSYDISSLTNGTEYEVQVQATNAAGDSAWSDSTKAKPRTVPSKPSPTLTPAHQKLTVSWSAPSDGGSDITGYKVRHRETSDTDPNPNTWTTSSSQTGTSYEISSLTNGTEYEVQVQATNAAGDSAWSDSTKAKPRTVPSKPAAPTLTSDDASLEVTWSAPSDGGSDITAYKVQHRQTGTTNWTTSGALGTSTLAYEITQLTNGTEYEVQVQATNAAGDSAWSDSSKAKPYTVPSKPSPTLTPADQKLTASWSAPSNGGSDITGYKVQYRPTGNTDWTTSSALGSSTTSYEISPLNNGTEYEVQVQATNAAGDSGYSDSVKATPRTVPAKPAAPGLAAADQKLTVTWTAPNDGGSAITGYKVRHRISDVTNSPWTTSSALGTSTLSYEITNLTNGVEYDVQVQATNVAGDSAWSDSSEATPPSLTASNLTDTAATLTLGGTISGNTTDSWWLKRTSPADTTCTSKGTTYTHSLTSLTPGDTYTYTAYSDSSCSSSFADVTFTTLELTASKITDTTATLTLTGNTSSWYYKADKSPDNSCSSSSLSGSTTTKDLTGLSSGTTYNYSAYSNSTCTTKIATAAAFTTSDTTVSNLGNGPSGLNCTIGRTTQPQALPCLVGFTTGSATNGYTLDSITANFSAAQTLVGLAQGFKVSLHLPSTSGDGSVNETAIANATFSGNDPVSAGWHTYDCSGSGCQLSANTTYYLVMTVSSAAQFQYFLWRTTSNFGEQHLPASNGWSVADCHKNSFGSSCEIQWTTMFKVSATEN